MIALGNTINKTKQKSLIRKAKKTNYHKKIVTQSIIYGYHTQKKTQKKRQASKEKKRKQLYKQKIANN